MQVEIRDICKYFGPVRANDGISFTFESGKIYAILGENGAGKSTLMKILSGYQSPTKGQIVIDERAVALDSPSEAIVHGIGMLYQDPLDFAPLTVLENYISGRPGGFSLGRGAARADLQKHCAALGFSLNPNALLESLTVGERQQLEIVRLISLGVRFLILDEPTTGISAEQKTQLFNTLKRLAHEEDMAVAIVSHKLTDVEELCDAVMVLRRGKLVGQRELPCPTKTLVELMFGKYIEKAQVEQVEKGRPMLTIEQLPIHARLFSIPEIDLTVHESEVIGLAGLDGSGQDDFMREIAGIKRPTWADHVFAGIVLVIVWLLSGHILEESRELMALLRMTALVLVIAPTLHTLWQATRRRFQESDAPRLALGQTTIGWRGYRDLLSRGVVYLPSGRIEEGLVSGLTVMEHVALASRHGVPWINWLGAWRRAKTLIKTFDVRGRPLDPIQNLSGGNQQRVSVGMLADELRLILLENPTRGLDVESAQRIWSLLLQRREQGTCIIFSSPDLDEIIDYSDRVLVFSSGQVTLVDDVEKMTTTHLGELIGGKH